MYTEASLTCHYDAFLFIRLRSHHCLCLSLTCWLLLFRLYPARAGLKGLCADSARAVTGRRCPHSGEGEDFFSRQPDFFTETAVNRERKVEKIDPKVGNEPSLRGLQMGHRPKLGSYGKIGFFGQKPRFWAQKKGPLLSSNHVMATTGKSCSKKKVAFSQINISLIGNFG